MHCILRMVLRGFQLQVNGTGPYLCANVENSKTAANTPVITYSCNGVPNERWDYLPNYQFHGVGTDNGDSTCVSPFVGTLVSLSLCQDVPISGGAVVD